MKKFRNYVIIGLVSILSIFLVSCSQKGETEGGATKGEKIKIGVSIANFDDTFLTYMMDGMKKYAATDSNIELEFVDAKEDISKQMNQVENFVTQGKDAIIIVPVDTSASGPMTLKMSARQPVTIPCLKCWGIFPLVITSVMKRLNGVMNS